MPIQVGYISQCAEFAQVFTVKHYHGEFVRGDFVPNGVVEEVRHYGTIYPTTPNELRMLPEADHDDELYTFVSVKPIYITQSQMETGSNTFPDLINWHGKDYKMRSVMDYRDFGYYLAIGEAIGHAQT